MRAAIISHYYMCRNYGGCLQAYALCRVLRDLGCDAEQLCYSRKSDIPERNSVIRRMYRVIKKEFRSVLNLRIHDALESRYSAMSDFRGNKIPHSKTVYDSDSISGCVSDYDVFITGSDQVWHPSAYCPAFGLNFVPHVKTKLSYAASIAKDRLTEDQLIKLSSCLSDFSAISVREDKARDLLKDWVRQPIRVTLDPTLLLTSEQWDDVCSPRIVKEPYLFCFFLGDSVKQRELARRYAEARGLKLVTVSFLTGYYRKCDIDFGDLPIMAASPEDIVSLIKHSEIVFTDSFHAVTMSVVYKKQFVVFDRIIGSSMGSRVSSLLSLLSAKDRFCDDERIWDNSYIN
ncbi:MAG: polysaccharide pyruvyl transferase family protein, partial [Oscillospiraceae bacterium]|nr:polysaccharide pyruvyl transferase family protein [Oscillospiraceae bacterium]